MSNVVSLPHIVLSVSPTTSSQPLCITEEGLIPWTESAGGLWCSAWISRLPGGTLPRYRVIITQSIQEYVHRLTTSVERTYPHAVTVMVQEYSYVQRNNV